METEVQGNYVTKNKVKFLVTQHHTPEGPHQHFIVPSSSKEKLLARITQLGMSNWHYVLGGQAGFPVLCCTTLYCMQQVLEWRALALCTQAAQSVSFPANS